MATAEFSATAGSVKATAKASGGVSNSASAASTADTDAATTITNLATVLTDYDAIGAAIVAISGDTYSNVTHQFTEGGSTGLTSAQLHTQMTSLNAMITAFLTAQTAAATTKTATAATVTATGGVSSDAVLYIGNVSNIGSMDVLLDIFNALKRVIAGSGLLKQGSPSPRAL